MSWFCSLAHFKISLPVPEVCYKKNLIPLLFFVFGVDFVVVVVFGVDVFFGDVIVVGGGCDMAFSANKYLLVMVSFNV